MSIVLQIFFTIFAVLSFYTKHMFNLFYVNQVFHIVILVDNVDNFVYNLIISLFADFFHVDNFLDNFSLIHHGSTGFVHIAKMGISGLSVHAIHTCTGTDKLRKSHVICMDYFQLI